MINLKSASFLIGLISLVFAYLIAITIANAFRAWMAKKMGDDTAEKLGFLTLNPLQHIDFIGFGVLFALYFFDRYFGWGRYIPIDPINIQGRWRGMKLTSVYLADFIAHFCMALVGIIILVLLFDTKIIDIARFMLVTQSMSHLYIAQMYPTYATPVIVVGFIVIVLVYFNVLLGVLHLIVDGCHLATVLSGNNIDVGYRQYPYNTILIPLILVLFVSEVLRGIVISIIASIGYLVAYLIGIV